MWLPETGLGFYYLENDLNPLPPNDAARKQKSILEDLFGSVSSQFKKYHPSGNRKFNYLGIFQRLKLRNLIVKIHQKSLYLNFTSNILGCYGLNIMV